MIGGDAGIVSGVDRRGLSLVKRSSEVSFMAGTLFAVLPLEGNRFLGQDLEWPA
jgi:hypothetical protein